jgi:hypothetical protein
VEPCAHTLVGSGGMQCAGLFRCLSLGRPFVDLNGRCIQLCFGDEAIGVDDLLHLKLFPLCDPCTHWVVTGAPGASLAASAGAGSSAGGKTVAMSLRQVRRSVCGSTRLCLVPRLAPRDCIAECSAFGRYRCAPLLSISSTGINISALCVPCMLLLW